MAIQAPCTVSQPVGHRPHAAGAWRLAQAVEENDGRGQATDRSTGDMEVDAAPHLAAGRGSWVGTRV
jgi:hypothetical protein